MLDELIFKKDIKLFLKNELKQEKNSGTYLFYGDKGVNLLELALAFTMGINCPELEHDYCGVCKTCKKIKHKNYADLEVIGLSQEESKIGIDKIKDAIYKASSSSYEGRKKIFIIKDIESMNKYSSNALLKIMEEPPKGTFFILLSNTLNILPTIVSRSIVVKVPKPSHEELNVSKEAYDFFLGNMEDILEYKKLNLDLEEIRSYMSLGDFLYKYLEYKGIKEKIELYCGIKDYLYNRKILKKSDKLRVATSLYVVLQNDKLIGSKSSQRRELEELLYQFIVRLKDPKYTEKLIEIKQGLRHNTNIQATLMLFFMSF